MKNPSLAGGSEMPVFAAKLLSQLPKSNGVYKPATHQGAVAFFFQGLIYETLALKIEHRSFGVETNLGELVLHRVSVRPSGAARIVVHRTAVARLWLSENATGPAAAAMTLR